MVLNQIHAKAKLNPKRIVYPESNDVRIIEAAKKVKELGIAEPILINSGMIADNLDRYSEEFYNVRKHKGVTIDSAREIMKNPTYFGTMMVHLGEADGLVAGACQPTADTLKPALQIIKTKQGFASSYFIMDLGEKIYFFADCGFVVNPNADELSAIAIDTADSVKALGIEPKIAMLAFSTKGSASHSVLDKVIKATELVKEKRSDLVIDGELQLDAAIIPEVAQKKCSSSVLGGNANVLIFPDLHSGNIGYKLVERLAKAKAIGPILQGLNKPVNDLSRGCSVQDVVDVSAVTVVQSQALYLKI